MSIKQKAILRKPLSQVIDQNKNRHLIYYVLLIVVTALLYLPALNNEFNSWDDAPYLMLNPNIELTKTNVENSFLRGEYHRMYVPLTALSHSVIYHFFGFNPKPYYVVNLLIHLTNTAALIYLLILLGLNFFVVLFAAALFALHPMQAECIAYAAGRRDVLYVLFYLPCLIFYVKYLSGKNRVNIYYALSVLFALLALLSKGQALTIPAVLVLISLYLGGNYKTKMFWLDKLPFVLITAVIAYKVFSAPQYATGNYMVTSYLKASVPILYRPIYACYGFIQYIILLLVPYKLSVMHPYPRVNGSYVVPAYFYLYFIPLAALAWFFIKYALTNRTLWFGIGFYAVNIAMLLQLIPNGYCLLNDHYVYFAGIGVFFMVSKISFEKLHNQKQIWITAALFYVAILAYCTHQRIGVFSNSLTLWTDVIEKYPDEAIAYHNRASIYEGEYKDDLALADYTKAIELNPKLLRAYLNRALIEYNRGEYDKELADLNISIAGFESASINLFSLDDRLVAAKAYMDRAIVNNIRGNSQSALRDLNRAAQIDSTFPGIYLNRGLVYSTMGNAEQAFKDFDKAIVLNPKYDIAYINRAIRKLNFGDHQNAMKDFDKAIALNPSNSAYLYQRALAYKKTGNPTKAVQDLTESIRFSKNFAEAYQERADCYYLTKHYELALNDCSYLDTLKRQTEKTIQIRQTIQREKGL